MRIERIITKQGHAVPKTASYAKGPFPPELYQRPEVVEDYIPVDQDVPVGGTAQNNFTEPKLFRCRYCDEMIYEPKLGDHQCENLPDGKHP